MNRVMTRTRYRQTNAAFTVSREYDALDRVTDIVYAARDGTPLYALSYAYEPDGLVTQRVVTSSSGVVTNSYAYDGLMRLVSESDSLGNSASYAYDLCGNRLSVTTPSGTATSTYTHNRRDADAYDAGGRVTRTVNGRGQTLDLAWNLQGELVSVSTNGVFAEGYAYDALGRRISTTDAGGTVYHAYDGIHCVADLALDGTLLRSYMWGVGIDNLLAVTLYGDSTNTLYAVTDPLGTVHALVGTNGVPAVTYAYDSWGNLLSVSGDETLASLRFTWQGREYSRATALYNFRARWYDPAAGRWLSKDPIGLEGGLNLYEAFGNNPVCFRDPEGRDAAVVLTFGDMFLPGEFSAVVAEGGAILSASAVLATGVTSFYLGTKLNEILDKKFNFNETLSDFITEQLIRFQQNEIKGEHTKNARRSTKDDHQNANARRKREQDPKKRYIPGKRKKHNKDSRNHVIFLPLVIPLAQSVMDEVK